MSVTFNDAITAMTWQAIQEIRGSTRVQDVNLISWAMYSAIEQGFTQADLRRFQAEQISGFGFFRGARHYVGLCQVELNFLARVGVMARATGAFEGRWVFMVESDGSIFATKDDEPIERFQEFEGLGLALAVFKSALTADI